MLREIGAQWEAGGALWVNERGLSRCKSKHAASWFVCVWRVKVSQQGVAVFVVFRVGAGGWWAKTAHLKCVTSLEESRGYSPWAAQSVCMHVCVLLRACIWVSVCICVLFLFYMWIWERNRESCDMCTWVCVCVLACVCVGGGGGSIQRKPFI